MGWKNVKEQYGIGHIVRVVEDKGICIGSGYVHDLIVISPTDRKVDWSDTIDRRRADIGHNLTIWRSQHLGRGEPFDGWVKQWTENPEKLRSAIDAPDKFAQSITVYTYDYDGNIIEKKCEELGWPNITHDGECMYENTFSADRNQVVTWAKENIAAALESTRGSVDDAERELRERRKRLAAYKAALVQIERN